MLSQSQKLPAEADEPLPGDPSYGAGVGIGNGDESLVQSTANRPKVMDETGHPCSTIAQPTATV